MRITEEQYHFIFSEFVCERLSNNQVNKILINDVENKENPGLVNILKTTAWQKDCLNETAYYIIKDRNNQIAFFFSLQTGCVFDSKDTIERRANNIRILQQSIYARVDLDQGVNVQNATNFLKSAGTYELNIGQLRSLLVQEQDCMQQKKTDISLEQNKSVYHVVNTYPSIELHIFCKNDNYGPIWKEKIRNLKFPSNKRMGEIFFWSFVVPIIKEIQAYTGCSFLYLFAADHPKSNQNGNMIENKSLINYYEDKLKIFRNMRLATNKPSFDYACIFMAQKISFLYAFQKNFFEKFNLRPEDLANAV